VVAAAQGNSDLELLVDDHRFVIRGRDHAADFVTCAYQYRPAARRPFVSTLVGPSGRNVLECGPADQAHQLGVWWAHGDVSGVDFALEHEREGGVHGRVEHVAFDEIVDDDPWFGFDEVLEWCDADGVVLLTERRVLLAHFADERWYTVDLDSTYTAVTDVTFGDSALSAMPGIRVAEPLTTYGGGSMTSSRGATREAGCNGERAAWIDRTGTRRGLWRRTYSEGLAVFDHPANADHPARWIALDYGPLTPLPGHHFTGGGALASGASFRQRHRLLVHEGDTAAADVPGHFARYVDDSRDPS
jgi:hypothetical protein